LLPNHEIWHRCLRTASLLAYPGIYPNVYIASHVILGIYTAAVAKCSQV